MRISGAQKDAILSVFSHFYGNEIFELFLFGSRASDILKGGDIDLLIVSEKSSELEIHKEKVLVQLKKNPHIGDRKIDLVYATPAELRTDPFLRESFTSAVKL